MRHKLTKAKQKALAPAPPLLNLLPMLAACPRGPAAARKNPIRSRTQIKTKTGKEETYGL